MLVAGCDNDGALLEAGEGTLGSIGGRKIFNKLSTDLGLQLMSIIGSDTFTSVTCCTIKVNIEVITLSTFFGKHFYVAP
jgi:hypothetical protein